MIFCPTIETAGRIERMCLFHEIYILSEVILTDKTVFTLEDLISRGDPVCFQIGVILVETPRGGPYYA